MYFYSVFHQEEFAALEVPYNLYFYVENASFRRKRIRLGDLRTITLEDQSGALSIERKRIIGTPKIVQRTPPNQREKTAEIKRVDVEVTIDVK